MTVLGDYLRTSSEDFLDGSWTVDCWFYYDASFPGTVEGLIALDYDGTGGSSNNAMNLTVKSGAVALYVSSNVSSGWNIVNGTTGGSVSASAWNHGAVVFDGSTYKAYLNGSQVISVTSSTAVASQSSSQIIVGTTADGNSAQSWNGYIDEVRVTQAALWTQAFTPPARRDTLSISDGMMYNGTCFDFDGTDDLVLTNDPVITGTGDFTLTAWINRATINTFDYICGNYGTGNAGGVEFYGINTGEIRCYILGSVTTSTALVADTWYHVGVRRLAGVVQLYINGVADGAAVTRASSITGSINFAIGNGPAGGTSENFDGKIADVKAFNVALSAANMKELYDDSKVIIPSNISQTNLKGWWPLAEGAGDICYDGSGNGISRNS